MQRRTLVTAMLSLPLHWTPSARVQAQPTDSDQDSDTEAPGQAQHTVSLQHLQAALAQRFPLRYPVPGMVNLDVQTPRLQLLPLQNRLGAELDILAAGPALQRSHQGRLGLDFALRFEATDRSIRAHRLRLQRLLFPTLQPGVVALLNSYAQALAERSLLEVVLHRLSPTDLALADGLGLQPGSITVTEAGLRIGLVSKPL
jgi:hypothetical protein